MLVQDPAPSEIPTMRFKDTLVHLDDSKSCADRARLALDLARAHLAGLYVISDPELPGSVLSLLPEETPTEQRRIVEARAKGAVARFRAAAEREGVSRRCPRYRRTSRRLN